MCCEDESSRRAHRMRLPLEAIYAYLLIYIYERQGILRELLPIRDSDQIGVNSKLGLGDDQLIKAKIEVLHRLKRRAELYVYCESLLQEATDLSS